MTTSPKATIVAPKGRANICIRLVMVPNGPELDIDAIAKSCTSASGCVRSGIFELSKGHHLPTPVVAIVKLVLTYAKNVLSEAR
jgi:hypothetical protein